ncbi:MAG: DUF4290 domain-containing protein [Crocinitomicaceae bacterium]|nr:DUF4290 domain-containing protein [Crocinitomicaceae bacterium]
MEYNTTRETMLLPEYGRNVQNMIRYAMKIENRTERNRAAQAIIEVMGQLNPQLRDVDDYRHKLWTHLFVMSEFKLDVDSPYVIPTQESLQEKPHLMEYPKSSIRYGHYGKYTQSILETSKDIADVKEKEYLKNTMSNFMKYQYLAYNNNAVENHVIANQLKELSKGELFLDNPDEELVSTNSLLRKIGGSNNNNNNKNHNKNKKKNIKNKKFIKK